MTKVFEVDWRDEIALAVENLAARAAIGFRRVVDPATCSVWAKRVLEAEAEWTHDFDGAQFTLGRAFYTHYETDRSEEYFDDAAESDARVEKVLPGMQERMREAVRALTGGVVRARHGWCGPGVHVFPPEGEVAERGGVVHYDIEGLTEKHARDKAPALTLVLMLQEPESGGGLKLWDVRFRGRDTANATELRAPSVITTYGVGGALLIDSYRLHQIQPFTGSRHRISITIHAAEVDDGVWETWF